MIASLAALLAGPTPAIHHASVSLGPIGISQWQAWGLTIAARTTALPLALYAEKLLWFAVGSMLVHSAACVLNDICDVDFDRQVGASRLPTSEQRSLQRCAPVRLLTCNVPRSHDTGMFEN